MRKMVPLALVLVFASPLALHAQQPVNWNDEAARQEMSDFRQFLASHTWIAKKLRQKPSLANHEDFRNGNPPLPQFLNAHPFIQSALKNDPNDVMRHAEEAYFPGPAGSENRWNAPGYGANDQGVQAFAQFLNDHPDIAERLRGVPSLANNQDFLAGNGALQQFLYDHPDVQRGLQADATGYMGREQQFASSGYGSGQGTYQGSWYDQAGAQEMRAFERFMHNHRWIANKLGQKPSLANNHEFLEENPPLPQFLNSHPFVQSQFRADPNGFMARERQFAQRDRGQAFGWGPHAAELVELNQFMVNHPWIGKQLQQNPKLANNGDFLNNNRELRDFLGAHPYLRQQLRQDPNGVIEQARELSGQN